MRRWNAEDWIIAMAAAAAMAFGAAFGAQAAPASLSSSDHRPDAIVDLTTAEGTALIKGQWRYSDARIVDADFKAPGPDLKPSGAPIATRDIEPKAGGAAFDDSAWDAIDATALTARRATGKLSFGWYRINVTIPERIGSLDPTGATVFFEITSTTMPRSGWTGS